MKNMRIGAIVVAAGMSSRMKAFKPLLKIKEKTMIETLVKNLESAGVNKILCVTGNKADELEPILEKASVSFVRNLNYKETSMFDSAKLGFKRLRGKCEAVFFLPADVPLFKIHSLKAMIEEMKKSGVAVVQPRYKGKRGHPLLIAEACFQHILEHDGTDGLRGALNTLKTTVIEMELPDPGLVMDADTPQDYNLLCEYAKRLEIPSVELCFEIQKWFHMQECTRNHSIKVAEVSMEFASQLAFNGYPLNTRLIWASALLHDIAKGQKNHAELGGKWIEELGYPEVASVISEHTDLPEEAIERIDERAIVYLADKLVKEDKRVSIDERFAAVLEKFTENEKVKEMILKRMKNARRIIERIDDISKS